MPGTSGLFLKNNILAVLRGQIHHSPETLCPISPRSRKNYRYAPEKWSVRQVFGHLADAERIFGYRATLYRARPDEATAAVR